MKISFLVYFLTASASLFILGEFKRQTKFELINNEYISMNHQDKLQSIDVSENDYTLVFNKSNNGSNSIVWYTIHASLNKYVEIILASNQTDWSECPILILKNETIICLSQDIFIESSQFRLRINHSSLVDDVYLGMKSKRFIVKNETYTQLLSEFREAYVTNKAENFIVLNENQATIDLTNKSTNSFYWYYVVLFDTNLDLKIFSKVNEISCPFLVIDNIPGNFQCLNDEPFHTIGNFKLRINKEALRDLQLSIQKIENISKHTDKVEVKTILANRIENNEDLINSSIVHDEYLIGNVVNEIPRIYLTDNRTEQRTFYNNNTSQTTWYTIYSWAGYSIELKISSLEIDWNRCPFALMIKNKANCLFKSYSIHNETILLRVNHSALIKPATIHLRSVIHSCLFGPETKQIQFIYSIPKIVYDSRFPCKYNVSIPPNTMALFKIEKFNSKKVSADCNSYVGLSGQFNSMGEATNRSIIKFCENKSSAEYEPIIIRNSFVLIDIGNAKGESVSIEINIKSVQQCGETFDLSNKTDISMTSIGFMTPKLNDVCQWHFYTNSDTYELGVSLEEYNATLDEANFKLIGYSFKDNEEPSKFLIIHDFKKPILSDKYIGTNELTLQFFASNETNVDMNNFKFKIYKINVKKQHFVYTKPYGYVISYNFPLIYPDYSYVDHEIRVSNGYRIVLLLESFNIDNCTTNDEYGVTITLDNNPKESTKLCGQISEKMKFYSFGNIMNVNLRCGKTDMNSLANGDRGYRFRYFSVPVCDNTYILDRDIINFHNSYSFNQSIQARSEYCKNFIIASNEQSRILFYFIFWELNFINEEQNEDCKYDYLSISSSYIKSSNPERKQIYCHSTKPSPIVSEKNILQLQTYLGDSNITIFNYSAGYVSYKYVYNKLSDEFSIDFSETIDKRAKDGVVALLEYRIEVPDDYYIIPTIYNCDVNLKTNGKVPIQIRTEKELYPFNLACGKDYYTILTAMSSVMVIEISEIAINELRENLKFSVGYKSLPRIFTSKTGHFESFNFSTQLFANRKQNINYSWMIDLESIYYVKLDILNLTNCNHIQDFHIQDSDRRIIYNKEQLCQNFNNGQYSFDFATNKIIITFNYVKSARSQYHQLPYLKCSYNNSLRILSQRKGEISLSNGHTHFKRNWIVKAPVDHLVVVDVDYSLHNISFSQLKFSYLGDQYSSKGIYHFNFGNHNNDEDNASVVVSKANIMKIEYTSYNNDTLNLSYKFSKNTFNAPCGIIRPFTRGSNQILPKLCDQSWVIKSDYSKMIKIFASFVDLPSENPCSTAKLNVIDSNGDVLASLCGNIANMPIITKSSEVTIRFTSQNGNIFYEEEKLGHIYNGFKLFYNFIEDTGDCYFQNKSNILCGYKNIGESHWFVKENTSFIQNKDPEFSGTFCENCYLQLSNSGKPGRFISPLLPPTKKSLKFDYKSIAGLLTVSVIPNKMLDQAISLPLNLIETNDWISVQSIIIQPTFYQIVFEFLPQYAKNSSAALDNIQFYESLIACQDRDSFYQFGCVFNKSKDEECVKVKNNCNGNPCLNNGTCVNDMQTDSYKCICSYKYTGFNCDTLIDQCQQDCNDSEQCLKQSLICSKNFSVLNNGLSHCKMHDNPCNQLYQHGDCFDEIENFSNKSYRCSCNPLYTGEECETRLNKFCANNYCNDFDKNAKCYNLNGKPYCKCSAGFSGSFCQNIDDCVNVTCNNGGKCVDDFNSFKCECPSNYSGKFCEQAKICDKCIDSNTIYCDKKSKRCTCNTGYTGTFCETKVDFCVSNPCIRGICINKVNKFECLCDKGYKGLRCDTELSICDSNPCNNGGTCVISQWMSADDNQSKFSCQCNPGFTGTTCENQIDFCKDVMCQNGAKCYNEHETYSCDCRNDYQGANCDYKLNNCNSNNCAYDSTCSDQIEGYRCLCAPNKYGQFCNYTEDACLDNYCVNGICHKGDHLGRPYTCECHAGYMGDHCEIEIDECASSPCLNGGKCYDTLNDYICLCSSKYSGKRCETELSYCSLEKCNYSTTERCVSYSGGFKCVCKQEFTGPHCESSLSKCEILNPCYSGVCVDDVGSDYKCINCLPGYSGKNCSEFINFCDSNPCKNSGACYSKLNDYYCDCKNSFSGRNCEMGANNVCESNKCKNSGICKPKSDEIKGYICSCPSNYTGAYCEHSIDLCKDVDCEFSYCVNGQCVCNPNIPYCKKNFPGNSLTCLNGGSRIDVLHMNERKPRCFCDAGLHGDFCENSIYCSTNKACGNANYCKTVDSSYECNCMEPLIGHKCNKNLDEYLSSYGQLVESLKLEKKNSSCQFGSSRISRILLGLITIMILMSTFVGFIIGHCIVKTFERNSLMLKNDSENFKEKNLNLLNDELTPRNIGWFQQTIPRPMLK